MTIRIILLSCSIFLCLLLQPLYGKGSDLEQGIRFLKLGNSYREIGFYNDAKDYLLKGKRIAQHHKSLYWLAVSEEYLGMLESDQGDAQAAENHFIEAVKLYDKILPPTGSSLESTMHLLNPSQKFLHSEGKKTPKVYSKKNIEIIIPEDDMDSPIEDSFNNEPKEENEFDDLFLTPSTPKSQLPQLQSTPKSSQSQEIPSTSSPKESIGIEENEFDQMVEDVLSGKPTTPPKSAYKDPDESKIEQKLQSLERENKELKQQIELLRNELELMLNKKEAEPKKSTKSKTARSA